MARHNDLLAIRTNARALCKYFEFQIEQKTTYEMKFIHEDVQVMLCVHVAHLNAFLKYLRFLQALITFESVSHFIPPSLDIIQEEH